MFSLAVQFRFLSAGIVNGKFHSHGKFLLFLCHTKPNYSVQIYLSLSDRSFLRNQHTNAVEVGVSYHKLFVILGCCLQFSPTSNCRTQPRTTNNTYRLNHNFINNNYAEDNDFILQVGRSHCINIFIANLYPNDWTI
jgi:hypothetical protein